jgi:putative aminopeptidase FrvX
MLSIGTTQLELLEKLCNAMSVSGDEGEVRRIILEEVKPYADEVKVDALGSVLVRKTGTGKKPLKVLLDAHMDEVGFMIVNDDGDGFFQFETVGGIDPRHLVGKQMIMLPA